MYGSLFVVLTRRGDALHHITFRHVATVWIRGTKVELQNRKGKWGENETFRTVDSNDWLISVSHI